MINLTEDDVEFIVSNIVTPCFEAYINKDLEFKDKYHDTYERLFNVLADRIRQNTYEMARDRSFFLAFLGQHGYTREQVLKTYDNYCEEYDKLNKHLLDDKKDVNEV